MALSRVEKQDLVSEYADGLAAAEHAFVVGFSKITVPEVTDLRSRIRETGASYIVVKNTLALRAIQGKPLEGVQDVFEGPTAVAYSNEDPVSLAKALTEFAKTVPALEFKGGLVEGKVVAADQIKDIAQMPSREELLTKLVFLLQSPITRMVRGLAALPRQLVVVMDQVAKGKG